MYEVAQVAGNKVEAACAIRSLSNIMGQISSNHNNSHSNGKSSKIHHRHSSVQPTTAARIKDDQIYRDHLKDQLFRVKDSSSKKTKELYTNGGAQIKISDRPVTISEMNAYNIEKNDVIANKKINPKDSKDIYNSQRTNNHKEFYSVGEGYHKTENCYYKTPDGGYHKLPPDSFHKMSEGCYNKMPDGSFRKLDDLNNVNSQQNQQESTGSQHHRVKSNVMKFLKRSKSHTPATIKELHKEKEHKTGGGGAAAAPAGHNRRVMVNMLDGGGLPIVAKSKHVSERSTKQIRERDKENRSGHKVFFSFKFEYIYFYYGGNHKV